MNVNLHRIVDANAGLVAFEDAFADKDAALAHITKAGYAIVCCEEDMANPGCYDVFAAKPGTADIFTIEPKEG